MRVSLVGLALTLLFNAPGAFSQSDAGGGYRFQPPRPPPLDGADFDDADEDTMELGDDGFRPPPPPGAPGSPPGGMPPGSPSTGGMSDYNGGGGDGVSSSGYTTVSPGKFRFKIVEGEYWQKGKRRGRGKETRVSGSSSSEKTGGK